MHLTTTTIPDGTGDDDFGDVGPTRSASVIPSRCWDGEKIARAFHRDYNRFIATVRALDSVTRARWAVEYAAYMSPLNKTGQPLTAEHVLGVWHRAMEHQQERARGAS